MTKKVKQPTPKELIKRTKSVGLQNAKKENPRSEFIRVRLSTEQLNKLLAVFSIESTQVREKIRDLLLSQSEKLNLDKVEKRTYVYGTEGYTQYFSIRVTKAGKKKCFLFKPKAYTEAEYIRKVIEYACSGREVPVQASTD